MLKNSDIKRSKRKKITMLFSAGKDWTCVSTGCIQSIKLLWLLWLLNSTCTNPAIYLELWIVKQWYPSPLFYFSFPSFCLFLRGKNQGKVKQKIEPNEGRTKGKSEVGQREKLMLCCCQWRYQKRFCFTCILGLIIRFLD